MTAHLTFDGRPRQNFNSLLHLNLDDSWSMPDAAPTIDVRKWGPHLRFCAPPRLIEQFYRELAPEVPPFIVYGSGDFHHLTALWIRRAAEPLVVVSFDNHPDWDIRPPWWSCGSWVNRALELPHVQKVSVWGCGNFECWWPGQAFGNRRAEREGKLDVHAWADDRPARRRRRGVIFRETWRQQFDAFVAILVGTNVYVTVDIDCLRHGDAVTNWENGKFSTDDVVWALGRLRSVAQVIAGDICGAYAPAKYARAMQRLVATIDHPRLPAPDAEQARAINLVALEKLWPVLAAP